MFEGLKIEPCPYGPEYIRVRFKVAPETAEKLRSVVRPYYTGPEFDEQIGGELIGAPEASVYYGIDEFGPGEADELTVSLRYDRGDDALDFTAWEQEMDLQQAWFQFLAPLRIIKHALEA